MDLEEEVNHILKYLKTRMEKDADDSKTVPDYSLQCYLRGTSSGLKEAYSRIQISMDEYAKQKETL